jgi:hypothetical protein
MPPSPQPLPFPSGKGPAKGQNDLVEKLVTEDRLDHMISVWRESVLKNGEAGCGSATTKLYPLFENSRITRDVLEKLCTSSIYL